MTYPCDITPFSGQSPIIDLDAKTGHLMVIAILIGRYTTGQDPARIIIVQIRMYVSPPCPSTGKAESPFGTSVGSQGVIPTYRCQIHELVYLIPHIPRQELRACNPFLAFPDQTSSPVVDPDWCDIKPIRSRHP